MDVVLQIALTPLVVYTAPSAATRTDDEEKAMRTSIWAVGSALRRAYPESILVGHWSGTS